MSLVDNPHKILWFAVPAILAVSAMGLRKAIDLQVHDTYLIVGVPHFGVLLSLLLVLAGGGYWLMGRQELITWLTATHVVVTVLPCITILVIGLLFQPAANLDFQVLQVVNQAVLWLLLIAIGSQLLLVTNVA